MLRNLRTLYFDERGFVLTAELIIISTVLVLGLVTALSAVQTSVVSEMKDVGNAIGSLNQSYCYTGMRGCNAWCGRSSRTVGSSFLDVADTPEEQRGDFDCVTSPCAVNGPLPPVMAAPPCGAPPCGMPGCGDVPCGSPPCGAPGCGEPSFLESPCGPGPCGDVPLGPTPCDGPPCGEPVLPAPGCGAPDCVTPGCTGCGSPGFSSTPFLQGRAPINIDPWTPGVPAATTAVLTPCNGTPDSPCYKPGPNGLTFDPELLHFPTCHCLPPWPMPPVW